MLTSLYSDSYDDDDSLFPREEMRQVLKQKARNLFMLCDQENKGFASKRDIYRLENELPLTPEQLDEVFDVLDKDKNGCLTLEEFTEGLGMFLGIDSHMVRQDDDDENTDTAHVKQVQENDEKFEDFLDSLGAQNVFKDEDYVRNMWAKVKQDDPVMLRNFENFLGKITQELKHTKHEYSSLESTLRNRTNIHDEQVQVLYTEMEDQLQAEKEILLAQERYKEQKIRDELETELHLKDQQLQDFIVKHAEMEKRLQELNADDSEKKHENIKLEKERDTLELRLAASDKMLKDMQRHLELLRKKSLEEKRTRAKAALKVSEGIALERENLVKELLHLKKANKQLLDEKDELVNSAIGTPINGSDEDSSESSNVEKHVSFNLPYNDNRSPRTSKRRKRIDDQRHPHRLNRSKADEVERTTVSCHPLSCCEENPTDGAEAEFVDLPRTSTPCSSKREEECEVDDDFFQNHPHIFGLSDKEERDFQNNLNLIPNKKMESNAPYRNNLSSETLEAYSESQSKQVNSSLNSANQETLSPADTQVKYATSSPKISSNKKVTSHTAQDHEKPSPDRIYKVVFIGDSGVGKSSFIHRFCHNTFKPTFSATIGVDFQVKNIFVEGRTVALQLWDTAGQERFRSLTPQYFRKADGIVVVYDVTSELSFKNIRNWISQVKEGADEQMVVMLIGNKIDLCENEEDRVVKTKHGNRLADEFGTLFYETSAKNGNSIEESIKALCSLLTEKEDEGIERALKVSEDLKNKRKCC